MNLSGGGQASQPGSPASLAGQQWRVSLSHRLDADGCLFCVEDVNLLRAVLLCRRKVDLCFTVECGRIPGQCTDSKRCTLYTAADSLDGSSSWCVLRLEVVERHFNFLLGDGVSLSPSGEPVSLPRPRIAQPLVYDLAGGCLGGERKERQEQHTRSRTSS